MEAKHAALKARAKHGLEEFLVIAGYLWLVLTSFSLQRSVILEQHGIDRWAFGFAFINALALGKVMLLGRDFHFAEWGKDKPLIYATVYESGAFAVLLMFFKVLEDVGVSMYHGKTFAESLPHLAGHPAAEVGALGLCMFLALVPFFACTELSELMGAGKLARLFFRERKEG